MSNVGHCDIVVVYVFFHPIKRLNYSKFMQLSSNISALQFVFTHLRYYILITEEYLLNIFINM